MSINKVVKHFLQVASKRRVKQTRCFNFNLIYCNFSKWFRGIVVINLGYCTGDRGSIPTQRRLTWQVNETLPESTNAM